LADQTPFPFQVHAAMLALSIIADHRLIDARYGNGCIPRARSHTTGEEQASVAAAGGAMSYFYTGKNQ